MAGVDFTAPKGSKAGVRSAACTAAAGGAGALRAGARARTHFTRGAPSEEVMES
jgi:hypothetical protein